MPNRLTHQKHSTESAKKFRSKNSQNNSTPNSTKTVGQLENAGQPVSRLSRNYLAFIVCCFICFRGQTHGGGDGGGSPFGPVLTRRCFCMAVFQLFSAPPKKMPEMWANASWIEGGSFPPCFSCRSRFGTGCQFRTASSAGWILENELPAMNLMSLK